MSDKHRQRPEAASHYSPQVAVTFSTVKRPLTRAELEEIERRLRCGECVTIETPDGPMELAPRDPRHVAEDLIDEGRNAVERGDLARWLHKRIGRVSSVEVESAARELLLKTLEPRSAHEIPHGSDLLLETPPLRRRWSVYWGKPWRSAQGPAKYFRTVLKLRIRSRRADVARAARIPNSAELEHADRQLWKDLRLDAVAVAAVDLAEDRSARERLVALIAAAAEQGVVLSPLELQAIEGVAAGRSLAAVARDIGRAPATLRVAKWRGMRKLRTARM